MRFNRRRDVAVVRVLGGIAVSRDGARVYAIDVPSHSMKATLSADFAVGKLPWGGAIR